MLKAARQSRLGQRRHGAGGINAAHSAALHHQGPDIAAHLSAPRPYQVPRTAGEKNGQRNDRRDEYQTVEAVQRATVTG